MVGGIQQQGKCVCVCLCVCESLPVEIHPGHSGKGWSGVSVGGWGIKIQAETEVVMLSLNWTRWSGSAGVSGFRPERRRGRTDGLEGGGGGGHHHRQSAQHSPQSPDAGMESTRAHRITRLDLTNGSVKITGKPDMRADRHRGLLHLQRTVMFLVALTIQPQVSHRLSAISGGT